MNEARANRYHRLKRRAHIISLAWSAVLLAGLLATGTTVLMRNAAESIAARVAPQSWHAALVVVAYVVMLSLINEAVGLLIAFYSGFLLERRFDLSNERIGGWLIDQAKSFVVGLTLACGGASLVYGLIRRSPDRWWLSAGGLFSLLIVALSQLAPVLFIPLFYSIKPLGKESLKARLLDLAERAGARVLGTYEWGLGQKTKKANAALTGIGGTRRILVSDTMLAEYSDDEIEVVLAHELGHHVHGDIWKGIAFESALVLSGFYLGSRALAGLVHTLGLSGVEDAAGLPLLMLVGGGLSLAMVPLAHAMSRAFERRADRFALEMTRNPSAFISAMRRLGAQNLAEEHPSRLVQLLFYSHPPIRERIARAEGYGRGL